MSGFALFVHEISAIYIDTFMLQNVGSATRGDNQLRDATHSESGGVPQGARDCRGAAGVVQVILKYAFLIFEH